MSNVFVKFSFPVFCYLRSRTAAVTTKYMKQELIQSAKNRITADPNTLPMFKKVISGIFFIDKLQNKDNTHIIPSQTHFRGILKCSYDNKWDLKYVFLMIIIQYVITLPSLQLVQVYYFELSLFILIKEDSIIKLLNVFFYPHTVFKP